MLILLRESFLLFHEEYATFWGRIVTSILFFIENHWNQNFTLFLHNKFHPKQLKTVHIHDLIILSSRNLRGTLLLGLSSHEVTSLIPSQSWGLIWRFNWGMIHFQVHSHGPQFLCLLATGIPISCSVDLSIGQLITWKLASSEQVNKRTGEIAKMRAMLF